MPRFVFGTLVVVAVSAGMLACSCGGVFSSSEHEASLRLRQVVRRHTVRGLSRFESKQALRTYLHQIASALEERQHAQRRAQQAQEGEAEPAAPPSATSPAADSDTGGVAQGGEESITNTQEQGVDEGDIVKAHGDHLVVLRRGRLFSIDLSHGQRRPISRIDLAQPGPNSQYGSWYDEMLIHGDEIVVVGYSYNSTATELLLFRIDDHGVIRRHGGFHLRSNDYYSSRNYASRLLGDTLVFYMPYSLLQWNYEGGEGHLQPSFPAMRMARPGADDDDWREIVVANDIFRPIQPTDFPILHTVVTCKLGEPSLRCNARGIIGPYARNFYVSGTAVYIWVHEGYSGDAGATEDDADAEGVRPQRRMPRAVVYQLPLNGGTPGALRVEGAPTDQFSFQESGDRLNVLVRAEGGGDWMWAPEVTAGDIALVRMPLAWFDEGVHTVPASAYARLPRIEGYSLQNRFVGDHVLYGTGGGWGGPAEGAARRVFVHAVPSGATTRIELPHGVDRIEPMGRDAVVVGSDGANLHFTSIDLAETPMIAGDFVQRGATQGETRSHGFFYKPQTDDEGILGLPVRRGDASGYEHLVEGSAEVVFLHVRDNRFQPLGALRSRETDTNDRCQVSCVDWYGNARPIFYHGRVFALLGYELVEGTLDDGILRDGGRTMFLGGQSVRAVR